MDEGEVLIQDETLLQEWPTEEESSIQGYLRKCFLQFNEPSEQDSIYLTALDV